MIPNHQDRLFFCMEETNRGSLRPPKEYSFRVRSTKNISLRLISWRSFQALSSIANTWETRSAITKRTSTSFRKKLQRILMCRSGQARPFRLCLKENLQVAQNADQPAPDIERHAKLSRARSRSR